MKELLLLFLIFAFLLSFGCSDSNEKGTQAVSKTLPTTTSGPKQSRDFAKQLQMNTTDGTIDFYQSRIKSTPYNYSNYTKLGETYIQKARETGDTAYYDKAEGVLKKALELYPGSYAAVVLLGQVSSAKHDFRAALEYAKKAIRLKPGDTYAYGILGDAYMELGEYDEAEEAYRKMLVLGPSLYSYSRVSHIKEIRGDVEGAIQAMLKAIELGNSQNLPSENVAWAQYILGEIYFNKGDLKNAEQRYRESLETYRDYYYALSGLAKLRAAEGTYEESIKLYERAIGIVPLPSFVFSLGQVFEKNGDVEKASGQYELVEYIGLLSRVNEVLYNRELALFYADRGIKLDEALELAVREQEFKKDIYTYDTLAWVYYKRNQLNEALEASLKSLSLGTQDAKLYLHTGMIYYKLGNLPKAKEHLNKALSINPHFHLIHSETAEKTLKEIENRSSSANRD